MNQSISPKVNYGPLEEVAMGMFYQELALSPTETRSAPFKASRFTIDPGCESPLDAHAVREVWIIASGSGELVYDQQSSHVETGQVCYFEPHKGHLLRNNGKEKVTIFSLWWSDK